MRILNSSLRWEEGEEVYTGRGEEDKFWGEYWVLGGGDEDCKNEYSLKGDLSGV